MTTTTPSAAQPARSTSSAATGSLELAARAVYLERARTALDNVVSEGGDANVVRLFQANADMAEARLHAALAATVPGYDPGDLQGAVDAEVARYSAAVMDHLFRHPEGDPR